MRTLFWGAIIHMTENSLDSAPTYRVRLEPSVRLVTPAARFRPTDLSVDSGWRTIVRQDPPIRALAPKPGGAHRKPEKSGLPRRKGYAREECPQRKQRKENKTD